MCSKQHELTIHGLMSDGICRINVIVNCSGVVRKCDTSIRRNRERPKNQEKDTMFFAQIGAIKPYPTYHTSFQTCLAVSVTKVNFLNSS